MTKFNLYDVVRVTRIPPGMTSPKPGFRLPRIGDTGTVVMVYTAPEAYTVEAVTPDGGTEWLTEFSPDDLEKV